jgi:hypothetical protein
MFKTFSVFPCNTSPQLTVFYHKNFCVLYLKAARFVNVCTQSFAVPPSKLVYLLDFWGPWLGTCSVTFVGGTRANGALASWAELLNSSEPQFLRLGTAVSQTGTSLYPASQNENDRYLTKWEIVVVSYWELGVACIPRTMKRTHLYGLFA